MEFQFIREMKQQYDALSFFFNILLLFLIRTSHSSPSFKLSLKHTLLPRRTSKPTDTTTESPGIPSKGKNRGRTSKNDSTRKERGISTLGETQHKDLREIGTKVRRDRRVRFGDGKARHVERRNLRVDCRKCSVQESCDEEAT